MLMNNNFSKPVYKYLYGEVVYSHDKMTTAFNIASYYGILDPNGNPYSLLVEAWISKFKKDNGIGPEDYYYVSNNEVYKVWTYEFMEVAMDSFMKTLRDDGAPIGAYNVEINDTAFEFAINDKDCGKAKIISLSDYMKAKDERRKQYDDTKDMP